MPRTSATYRQAQQAASARLTALPHAAADLEASLLLCHLLGVGRSHLLAWPERELTADQQREYQALVERRLAGEPIAHILGVREFWSLSLRVTPETLIPRPETELLVERALDHLAGQQAPLIADLGTGSGAIALALASERPDAQLHACDRSEAALGVARENAERLKLRNLRFFPGDWCRALPEETRYRLIASNPPYIEADDPHLRQGDLPFEPAEALVSGTDGLEAIRTIAAQAPEHLQPGGWLLLEHGRDQGAAVRELLLRHGFTAVATLPDLAGHPRLTEGRVPA